MPTQPYTYNGRRVSSVTTIISQNLGWNKRPLMHWAWTQGRDGLDYRTTSQRAADIGSIAHLMVEKDLHGLTFDPAQYPKDLLEKAAVAFDAWLDWKFERAFEPIAIEKSLVGVYTNADGEEFPFGGTLDIAALKFRNNKVRAMIDLKTSNATYPDHKIQIAAYGFLWNQHHPDEPIERYTLLRIDKNDGSFHYHSWPQLDNELNTFLLLLQLDKYRGGK